MGKSSFEAVMAERRAEAKKQLQAGINRINEIADKICVHKQPLTNAEIHSLRAAATSWSRSTAMLYRLEEQGEVPSEFDKDEWRDECDDTARYVLDPF